MSDKPLSEETLQRFTRILTPGGRQMAQEILDLRAEAALMVQEIVDLRAKLEKLELEPRDRRRRW